MELQVTGAEELKAKFSGAETNVREALRVAIQAAVIDMEAAVKEKLSGPVLRNRTGRLRNSVTSRVTEGGSQITGIVGANTPYAAAHEYGTRQTVVVREHLREITQAFGRPLKFPVAVTVRSHDMDMNLPPRSFLRSTLAEKAPGIVRQLRIAIKEALEA